MARILVIEDNADNRALMAYLFNAFGHMTIAAENADEGLAALKRELPDLIVCDVHLPGRDGFDVVHELKTHPAWARLPIVAVTALAMVGDRDKLLAAGFDGYLAKPIEPEAFIAQIEGFLGPDHAPDHMGAQPAAAAGRIMDGGNGNGRSPVQSADGRAAGPPPATGPTVLIVDDSPTNQELLRQTLEPNGYRVRLASNVPQALEIARAQPPDLIVSDLHMCGADGFYLLHQIKADPATAAVPVLILTASVWHNRDRHQALSLGAVSFLTRPIEPEVLLAEIAHHVIPFRMRSIPDSNQSENEKASERRRDSTG